MKIKTLLICFAWCLATFCRAQVVPSPGHYQGVVDIADMLLPQEEASIAQKLKTYFDSSSTQIVVLTVPSLGSLTVEDYAQKVFETWGIGQKDKNNGVLLLIAKNEHKIRIHIGYGMEQFLPDTYCGDLISYVLTPNFKNNQFFKGINEATDLILARLKGEKAEFAKPGASSSEDLAKARTNLNIFWALLLAQITLVIFYIRFSAIQILKESTAKKQQGKKKKSVKKITWDFYLTAFMTAEIIILFAAGITSGILYAVLFVFFSKVPIFVATVLFLLLTIPMLYVLRNDIKTWLIGPQGSGATYSTKKGNKSSYYDSGGSSYSDSHTHSYSDYRDYSDYSDSYSDSFGGGSSGGGGASGGW